MNKKFRVRLKIGDVIRVPLLDERHAYVRYVRLDSWGGVVQVSDRISVTPRPLEEIGDFTNLLFPPVYVGLQYAVREAGWVRIGNLPIGDYTVPPFKKYFSDQTCSPPKPKFVAIWNGECERPIMGDDNVALPNLEPWHILSPDLLEKRIREGSSSEFIKDYEPVSKKPVLLE